MTFVVAGCAHAQQLIWQMFNAIEKGFEASGDDDTPFLNGQPPFHCFNSVRSPTSFRGAGEEGPNGQS